jgi:hypothetical protein
MVGSFLFTREIIHLPPVICTAMPLDFGPSTSATRMLWYFSLLHDPAADGDGLGCAQHHRDQMRVGVDRLHAAELAPGLVPPRPIGRTRAITHIVVEVGSMGRGQAQEVLPEETRLAVKYSVSLLISFF